MEPILEDLSSDSFEKQCAALKQVERLISLSSTDSSLVEVIAEIFGPKIIDFVLPATDPTLQVLAFSAISRVIYTSCRNALLCLYENGLVPVLLSLLDSDFSAAELQQQAKLNGLTLPDETVNVIGFVAGSSSILRRAILESGGLKILLRYVEELEEQLRETELGAEAEAEAELETAETAGETETGKDENESEEGFDSKQKMGSSLRSSLNSVFSTIAVLCCGHGQEVAASEVISPALPLLLRLVVEPTSSTQPSTSKLNSQDVDLLIDVFWSFAYLSETGCEVLETAGMGRRHLERLLHYVTHTCSSLRYPCIITLGNVLKSSTHLSKILMEIDPFSAFAEVLSSASLSTPSSSSSQSPSCSPTASSGQVADNQFRYVCWAVSNSLDSHPDLLTRLLTPPSPLPHLAGLIESALPSSVSVPESLTPTEAQEIVLRLYSSSGADALSALLTAICNASDDQIRHIATECRVLAVSLRLLPPLHCAAHGIFAQERDAEEVESDEKGEGIHEALEMLSEVLDIIELCLRSTQDIDSSQSSLHTQFCSMVSSHRALLTDLTASGDQTISAKASLVVSLLPNL